MILTIGLILGSVCTLAAGVVLAACVAMRTVDRDALFRASKILLFLLVLSGFSARAATNSIYFDLGNFGADSVAFKLVRIAPSAASFPRVEGNTVRGLDYGFRTTDALGRFTNDMVTGTYDITFTNRFRATTFQITTPETNFAGVLTAAELTTSGTNLPSNLAAYSQAAANARFLQKTNAGLGLANAGMSNILIRPRLYHGLGPTNGTATSNYVATLTNFTSGEWEWREAPGANGINASTATNIANSISSTNTLYVNVMAFGARGTNSANDSTNNWIAISNAMNHAVSGSTIFFPTGAYHVSGPITVSKQLNFLGAGLGGESLGGSRLTGNFSGAIIDYVTAGADNGISVAEMHINNSHAAGNGIRHHGFISAVFRRLHVNAFRAVELQTSTFTATLENSRISWAANTTNSIGVILSGHGTVRNCDIVGFSKAITAYGAGNNIEGNRIEVNTFGAVLGESADGSVSSFGGSFVGNTCENNGVTLRGTSLQGALIAGNRFIGTSNATMVGTIGVHLFGANATTFSGNKIGGAFTVFGVTNEPGADINTTGFHFTTVDNSDPGGGTWGFNLPALACVSYLSCNNPEGDMFCRSGGTNDLFSVWLDGARKLYQPTNGNLRDGNGNYYVTNSTGIDGGSGSGEANVNGEVSVTNATMFGLVNGKSGVTNLLRSIAARNGLVGTNEGGTNISIAIDPAVVASQANLTAASNALIAETITASNNIYTTETTRNAAVSNAVVAHANSRTNFWGIDVTNRVRRGWVYQGANTNQSIDWSGTNNVLIAPSNTVTVASVNTPSAGSLAQSIQLKVYATNDTMTIAHPSGIDWKGAYNGLIGPGTNTFTYEFDGTNIFGYAGQELVTGSSYHVVLSNAPNINSATIVNATASRLAATDGSKVLGSSAYSDTDIANLQGGTNGLNTRVGNLEGATNGLNSRVGTLEGQTNNFVTLATAQTIPGAKGIGTITVNTNADINGAVVTNNIGFKVGTVAGVGGANTNFTLQAQNDESIIYVDAGTTNVNIVAIMQYSSTFAYRGTLILTNRTGTARIFSLGATTNNWISLQQFDGITAPFTVTNSLAGRFDYEILGTNVQYSYKPMALPSN